MTVRIAIPEPSSGDPEYNEKCMPAYIAALEAAGATPVVVSLKGQQARVAEQLADVQGILLPGSRYDIDPKRFGENPIPECGEADPVRTAVDELMLQDAFNLNKPILAICHGTQGLNVWRNGSLVQDLKTAVNHSPGRAVADAHPVRIEAQSRLAALLTEDQTGKPSEPVEALVNSSHHQAIRVPGDNLRVIATSPVDGVIEAVELDSPDHFVLGVQWHPERTYTQSPLSRAIFAAFVGAAESWQPPQVEDGNRESSR